MDEEVPRNVVINGQTAAFVSNSIPLTKLSTKHLCKTWSLSKSGWQGTLWHLSGFTGVPTNTVARMWTLNWISCRTDATCKETVAISCKLNAWRSLCGCTRDSQGSTSILNAMQAAKMELFNDLDIPTPVVAKVRKWTQHRTWHGPPQARKWPPTHLYLVNRRRKCLSLSMKIQHSSLPARFPK